VGDNRNLLQKVQRKIVEQKAYGSSCRSEPGSCNVEIVDYHGDIDMSATKLLDPSTPGEILREDFMVPLGISILQ